MYRCLPPTAYIKGPRAIYVRGHSLAMRLDDGGGVPRLVGLVRLGCGFGFGFGLGFGLGLGLGSGMEEECHGLWAWLGFGFRFGFGFGLELRSGSGGGRGLGLVVYRGAGGQVGALALDP